MSDSSHIEKSIEAAMQAKGWLLPTTEEAAARLQAEIDACPIELPESLQSADAVFQRILQPRPSCQLHASTEHKTSGSELRSLAARVGGDISSDVRSQMKVDGENAQRELEQRQQTNKDS